ncbi:MAG: hypothetical protein IT291_00455 [Deltaproteobacteria bacterium]|nr:hypothetical protein [Deltaproteobacteria bacterium]
MTSGGCKYLSNMLDYYVMTDYAPLCIFRRIIDYGWEVLGTGVESGDVVEIFKVIGRLLLKGDSNEKARS